LKKSELYKKQEENIKILEDMLVFIKNAKEELIKSIDFNQKATVKLKPQILEQLMMTEAQIYDVVFLHIKNEKISK